MDEDYKQKEDSAENKKPNAYIKFKPEFYSILSQVLNSVAFYQELRACGELMPDGKLTPEAEEKYGYLLVRAEDKPPETASDKNVKHRHFLGIK